MLVYCPNIRMQAKEVAAHVEMSPGKVMPLIRYTEDAIYPEVSAIAEKYPNFGAPTCSFTLSFYCHQFRPANAHCF